MGFNKILIQIMVCVILVPLLQAKVTLRSKYKPQKMQVLADQIQESASDETQYFNQAFPNPNEIKQNEMLTGSLWLDSYSSRMYNNLHRASRVGDMVTIVIAETASGSKTAQTKTERKSEHLLSIKGLFGIVSKLTSVITGLNPEQTVDVSNESKHDGKGETKRQGSLDAKLTARVVKVLKNGDMMIRGQKNINVNGEDQTLVLEGFVRPYDIEADNTILSTYVADARIFFNGFGPISDKQKPGWLTHFLDKGSPI